MCGIAGWIDTEADLSEQGPLLQAMADTLACRGPDAAGHWLSPHAALAHRRLIVVDPAGGAQPMLWRRGDRTYVLTYNGELYNTAEVRRELELRGHAFSGHSDTEALLAAFVEWGPACLERLNGIFAFAVWCASERRLFLARDRLGVKPLFYARRGTAFLFASELKALLAHPAVEPEVDAEGLAEVLVLGPARTPGHGVWRGVAELLPGHCLEVDARGVRTRPYWQLPSRPHTDDLPSTVARVRELLQDAVERQLVADVPVCVLLSGGLDSSALTAFAGQALARAGEGPLSTWSIDHAGNERHFAPDAFQPGNDAPWVERVATCFGTRHNRLVIDPGDLAAALRAALHARDLPGMADVDASLYLFCRAIKQQATVALSGECADEVFGGYPWFRRPEILDQAVFPWAQPELRTRLLAPEWRQRLRPAEYLAERCRQALAEVPRLAGEDPAATRMRAMSYLNLTRWMPTLLDRKDRMSMAVGLEVRVPYCDHRLVEYAWNVPWELKACDGQEKGLLRRALRGVLPDDVLERRKSPFPKTHNPAYRAAVRAELLQVLADRTSPLLPLIDVAAVRDLADSGHDGEVPWFGQLMRLPQLFAYLIQVDAWLRDYRVRIV